MSDPAHVARQYATASMVPRIAAALARAGLTATPLGWRELAPLDHFHSRGVAATEELAAALAPEGATHVLDVGCGVGGPARLLAATYGCRVTGIDLTPEAVEAATHLSARSGLSDRTRFLVADALNLPFEDGTFDHARGAAYDADRCRVRGGGVGGQDRHHVVGDDASAGRAGGPSTARVIYAGWS